MWARGRRVPPGSPRPTSSRGATGPRRAHGRGAAAALAAGLALLGTLASGCGIRSTSVPVDAGAAPSRASCVLPGGRETADEHDGGNLPVRVYLACGSRVSPVERRVALPGDDSERLPVARGLLDALRAQPDAEEEAAGFKTAVPRDLKVSGARPGDPPATLRLSRPIRDLPAFALAQIVCTYADTAAAGSDRSVILAGPDDGDSGGGSGSDDGGADGDGNGASDGDENTGNVSGDDGTVSGDDADGGRTEAGPGSDGADDSPRRYGCDTPLRTHPEAAATAGTPL
ncbi:hypothetical protein K378_00522 [Streptomyces sp. Amel2xB2]|nr:hypothetical protein K378_00522 [Streptomyces sp. Amel2xB2]